MPYNYKSAKDWNKVLIWIFLIALLDMVYGCRYYYKVTSVNEPVAPELIKLQNEERFVILHRDSLAWHLTGITTNENYITGKIEDLVGHDKYKSTDPDRANRYKKNKETNESEVLEEIHIYTDNLATVDYPDVSIPINAITKIEVYEPDKGATTASWVFGAIGITLGTAAVVAIIVALTKSSCPFIYVSDGQSDQFIGEIYSGAIYPSLERDDYLPLPSPASGQKEYTIRMSNEVKEIQHTNFIELKTFSHPKDTKVLIDKYGNYHTFKDLQSPLRAENLIGQDISVALGKEDTLLYLGTDNRNNPLNIDGAILSFVRPANTDHAKLVLKARTSYWLDYVFTRFHQLFGTEYDCWVDKQESVPAKKMIKWNNEQNIPVSVYIENNGKWKYIDYFNIVGPMAAKEDILSIDLSKIKSDTLKLKLEYGSMFWELDYAAIDYSDNIALVPEKAEWIDAIDNKNQDVLNLLAVPDTSYYIQPEIGDQVIMRFTLPEPTDDEQTVIMHSQGYYQIIMDLEGNQQVQKLLTFRKKGRFPAYSTELLEQQYSFSKN